MSSSVTSPGTSPPTPPTPPVALELADIQGLAVFGYHLPCFRFLFLRIGSAEAGRAWIGKIVGDVTNAAGKTHPCVNVAFTHCGLAALGLDATELAVFDPAFQAGIENRADVLGDTGESAPGTWEGGLGTPNMHAALMLFAASGDELADVVKRHEAILASVPGMVTLSTQDAEALEPQAECREHFGFRDGISRITLEGSGPEAPPGQPPVKAGEFVLGYEDEAGHNPAEGNTLLRNGTFLVYRKLYQDVAGFRRWVAERATAVNLDPELVAAKLVGRWRSGAPLVLAPKQDDPELGADPLRNSDYGYEEQDPKGFACPIGSHIRRAHPRDVLAKTEVQRHLLMRRGLPYGPKLAEGAADDGDDRGVAGVFVAGDIARQFEFVQKDWLNSRVLFGLTGNGADPICGDNDGTGKYTVPGKPFAKKLVDLPRFTRVRGGAYLFAPSIPALQSLSTERKVHMAAESATDGGGGVVPGGPAPGGPAPGGPAPGGPAPGGPAPGFPAPGRPAPGGPAPGDAVDPGDAGPGDTEPGRVPGVPGDIHSYITSIVKIIPEKLPRLRAVLAGLGNPNRPSPIEALGTIHFARWAIIDNGTRLLFTTNFDQSWDAYIDKFIEVGSAGLDGIWSNCEGYPEGGSKDVEKFKEYVRNSEVTTAFAYTAYPTATVAEVRSALRAKKAYSDFLEEFQG